MATPVISVADREALEAATLRLELRLQGIHEEETTVLETIAVYRHVLAPFRTLPDDVIREIFVAYLEMDPNPLISPNNVPLLLTQISSSLRAISLSIPALWASIHIELNTPGKNVHRDEIVPRMKMRTDLIKTWLLRRSGRVPLSISVNNPNTSMDEACRNMIEEAIDVLVSCSTRWRDISFTGLSGALSRVADLEETDVPLLRSLILDKCYNSLYSSQVFKAPKLVYFGLRGRSSLASYSVNWSQLTRLELHGELWERSTAITSIARILQKTTSLIELNIRTEDITEMNYVTKISLPFLKVMSIGESRSQWLHERDPEYPGILSHFHAPMLERLALFNILNSDSLIALLKRSPHIQDLHVGRPSSLITIMEYLRFCPSLTSLSIGSIHDGDNTSLMLYDGYFLDSFVSDDERRRSCPQLETFWLGVKINASAESVRRFFTRKQGNISYLHRWKKAALLVDWDWEPLMVIGDLISGESGEKSEGGLKPTLRFYDSYAEILYSDA